MAVGLYSNRWRLTKSDFTISFELEVSEMVNCLHYFIVDDDGVCVVLNILSFDSLTLK